MAEPITGFAEALAETSGLPRAVIETVLADEIRVGRVAERDGQLELVRDAFDPETLSGLRQLSPGLALDQGGVRAAPRNGRPRLGWSARTIAGVLPRLDVRKSEWGRAAEQRVARAG